MTTATFHSPFSGAGGATRRLALALTLSVITHLLLVRSLAPDGAPSTESFAPHGALTVRIEPSHPETEPGGSTDLPLITRPAERRGDAGKVARAETGVRREADATFTLPQAPDPTYYSARDLDSYPRLAAPLELGRLAGGADANGSFRFELLIDERGFVSEISEIEGAPRRLGEELRSLLAATRFVPGQKDGQPVRSRVTLSVGPAAAPR